MGLLLTTQLAVILFSGYAFTETCFFLSAIAARQDGRRLYYRRVFYGFVLAVVALLTYIILYVHIDNSDFSLRDWFGLRNFKSEHFFWLPLDISEFVTQITQFVEAPLSVPRLLNSYIAVNVLILLGGLIYGHVINLMLGAVERIVFLFGYMFLKMGSVGLARKLIENTPKQKFVRQVSKLDVCMQLLFKSMSEGVPICFNMKSGISYVGVPTNFGDPQNKRNSHFTILPYRRVTRVENRLVTSDYFSAYADLYEGEGKYLKDLDEFQIVLPFDQVESMNIDHDSKLENRRFKRRMKKVRN